MIGRKRRKPGFQHLSVPNTGWRSYQQHLKLRKEKRRGLKRIPQYILCLVGLIILIEGGFALLEWITLRPASVESTLPEIEQIDKSALRTILKSYPLHNMREKSFEFKSGMNKFQIHTSIDPELQSGIIDSLDTKWAQSIGIVVMDPDTGQILAMVSHDSENPERNNCLRSDFPSASLFKIITAAAAVETCGFTESTRLAFNGNKYTLYKSQLKDRKNKYTNYTNLEKAFAGSINPVFGKIGQDRLGKAVLEKYAKAFAFNLPIDFDLVLEESVMPISDDPYNWAEIACGFNRKTTISPLHGTILAAAAVNGGKIMNPSIINAAAKDERVVYRRKSGLLSEAIKPTTARRLKKLMAATVEHGTARSIFRNRKGDPILSKLNIGGKTGSINNNPEQVKFDWFTGFAEDEKSGNSIAVCVLVAHKDYIGTRAASYFKDIVKHHYKHLTDTARKSS